MQKSKQKHPLWKILGENLNYEHLCQKFSVTVQNINQQQFYQASDIEADAPKKPS